MNKMCMTEMSKFRRDLKTTSNRCSH